MTKRPTIALPAKPPSRDTVITDVRDNGKPKKPKTHIKATLYLLPAVHEQFRKLSFQEHRSQQELFSEAMDQWLERKCGKTIRELVGE
jgi:hypothetical protein